MTGKSRKMGASQIMSQSAFVILGRAFGAIAGFVTMLMIAKAVYVAEFACVSVGLSTAIILSFLCTFNLEAASVRFMVRYREGSENALVLAYLRFIRHVAICGGLSVSGAAVVVILSFVPVEMQAVLIASALSAPLLAVIRVNAAILMGLSHPLLAILPRTFLRPLLFCLATGLFISLVQEPEAYHFILMLTLTAAIVLTLQYLLIRRFLQPYHGMRSAQGPRKEWVKVGLIIGSNALYLEHGAALCILSASFVLQSQDLAQLDIALRLLGFLRFAQIGAQQVIMPALAQSVVANDVIQSSRILSSAALIRVLTCLFGILALSGAASPVVATFGVSYAGADSLVYILTGEALVLMICGPAAALMSFSGTPERMSPVLLVTISSLIVGTLTLGMFGGALGVAIAYVCTRALWDGTLAILAVQATGVNPTLASLWGYLKNRQGGDA